MLDIALLPPFIPAVAESHDVITCVTSCTTVTQFGIVNQPNGITHGVTYNATNLNLTVTSVSFFWDGGGDGVNWFDLNNWSLDVLPGIGTDVVLTSGDNVVFNNVSATETVASLTLDIGSSLNLASGTLNNAGLLSVNGGATLALTGGDLVNNGDANFDGGFTHASGNATFNANALFNGAYSQSGGTETFAGTAAFNGSMAHGGGSAIFNGAVTMPGSVNVGGGLLNFVAGANISNLNNSWSGGTITGGAPLVLGSVVGDTTLAIVGPGAKTLDTITLDLNRNDINMSGSGNLVLVNGAVIDNTDGTSFNHSGNGGITGNGTFDNTNGRFNKLSGSSVIAPTVNFINSPTSLVSVTGGALTFAAGGIDPGNYNLGTNGTLIFANGRALAAGSTMNLAGNLLVGNGSSPSTLVMPGNLNYSGRITLNNASLDLSNLGGTLVLNNGALLGGTGSVDGNLLNASGVLAVGGAGSIGNLAINGNYGQGASAAMVIDVFNNGFTTVSDVLIVGPGTASLDGLLVIGFTTNSLGLVTADFKPFRFNSVSGSFSRVIDAAGNILQLDFTGGEFTILGTSPEVPDSVIDDLLRFADKGEELAEEVADNRSEADVAIEAMLEEQQEGGELVCR